MMTSDYDSHSDDDEEIAVSKRKRNAILDDESEEEAVLNQTDKANADDEFVNANKDSMNDNNTLIVDSGEIETLSKDNDNESDVDGNSIGNESVNELEDNDEVEDSNQSAMLSKNSDNEEKMQKKYTFDPSIYDAEESDEETHSKSPEPVLEDEQRTYHEIQNNDAKIKKSMGKEKSSKQQNKDKGKKPKPSENMREIRRESQRMVRESQVILPYHIPKQRTLAEFLSRKKSAPTIPIRTTAEQLISLGKQIQQLEKESEEFFKSDSSDNDDEDDDKDYVPDGDRMSTADSAKTNKTLIDVDDNETYRSEVDENFYKEKVTNNSGMEGFAEDKNNAQIDDDGSHTSSLLVGVAERLQKEIVDNSLEDTGKSDGNLLLLTNEATKISIDDNDTQFLEISTDISNKQISCDQNFSKESIPCKENMLKSQTTVNKVCLKTNPSSHLGKNGESECEDFTLDLTLPENSENVVENKEEAEKESFILDFIKPEDSENVMNKDEDKEESFTLDLTMPEDTQPYEEHKEKNKEDSFTLDLTMPEDSETIVEHKEEELVEEIKISIDSGIVENTDLDDNNSKENRSSNKSKKIELLSKINVDLTEVPTLSKSFGGEINLDSPPKKTGIIDLKERFFKHYVMDRKKKKSKSPLKVSVVSASVDEKGQVEDISKEVICTSSKPDEQWLEEIKEAELPGAKHSKLKAFLESKAKAKWKEDYEKRLQEYKMNEEEMVEGDKADYEHEAILDDEDEEAEMTNSEEEDEEEELVEDDVDLVDKKRKQSKFVEDEADVSEDDEVGSDNGVNEEEEDVEENEDDLLGYNESDGEGKDSDNENRERRKKKIKKRKRAKSVDTDEECEDDSDNDGESGSESSKRETKLITSDSVESENDEESPRLKSKLGSDNDESESDEQAKTELISSDNEDASQSMEDLADICSGKFPTQPVSFSQLEMADSDNLLKGFADSNSQLVGESQNFDLSLPEDSQLLDRSREEEESDEEDSRKRRKKCVLDSDDEEEDGDIVLNRSHKKRARAVQYSDDEDEQGKPDTQNDDDEMGSENSEELVLDEIGNEELELDYDSEENEVVRDPRAFIDREAELSESEWGSEDEDEKDLDKFEEEAGDQEVLDEDEVNRELGKIHMQQMLVDDKRDVRILQELLLEDGELHSDGAGRQRQFRWANADSGFVGDDPTAKDSDDDDSDHEEDEENWRKKRHERELFLNKKNARLKELGIEEEDDEDEEDGLLGMGRALVKKMQTSTSKPPINVTSRVSTAAVTMNCKFMAKNMRGSFLTSSEQYLSRLAHITTKVGSESNVNGPKNSRNFVFSIISPKKDEEKEDVPEDAKKLKKRKASENATNAKKKIHISDDKGNEKRKTLLEVLG